MTAEPREILIYVTPEGKSPFEAWLISLRDNKIRTIIKARIKRLEFGNLGNYRSVGEGVYELKINYGPGFRIYFGQIGLIMIILLCGGDKSTQNQDIKRAKEYWKDYRSEENGNK